MKERSQWQLTSRLRTGRLSRIETEAIAGLSVQMLFERRDVAFSSAMHIGVVARAKGMKQIRAGGRL